MQALCGMFNLRIYAAYGRCNNLCNFFYCGNALASLLVPFVLSFLTFCSNNSLAIPFNHECYCCEFLLDFF